MKRILHIVGAMAPGGYENFIMNIYRRMDRSKVQFDFIVHVKKDHAYDEEIEALGGRLFYITRKSVNPLKNFLEIRRVVSKHQYNIVCRHSDSAFPLLDLLAARLGGARDTIMHSHSTTTANGWIHRFFRLWMGVIPARRFACSQEAGRWMYKEKSFTFVPNAIDTKGYRYDIRIREKMQEEWQTGGKHVYGHVGNFVYAKNHLFLLEVFREIGKKDPQAVFFLIGEGELREEIEQKIRQERLEEKVILTGRRKDVASFLQLFDLLLFPSRYEGLPVALVEAQTAGLPCLVSDQVTQEIALTDRVRFQSLKHSAEDWAKEAIDWVLQEKGRERKSYDVQIREAGYGIEDLVTFYETL